MAAPLKTVSVSGYGDCSGLSRAEKEKVVSMVCGDWSLGRIVDTPIGAIDRSTDPVVTIEIEYVPAADAEL